MPRLRYFVPVLILAGLIALLAFGLRLNPRRVPSPLIGKAAPSFDLATLGGTPARMSAADLQGKPRVVNFFASWCVACKTEHPFLMQLAKADHVALIGVDYKDTTDAVREDLEAHGSPYHVVLLDPNGTMGLNWGVYGVPETFVLDADGTIRYKWIGPLTPAAWREHIAPLLRVSREARR